MYKVRVLALTVLATLLIAPIYADIAPVAGSSGGTFANPTGGSTADANNWYYDGQNGFVTFTGTSFSGSTPHSFNLGSIVLSNSANQGDGTFTADLDLVLTFTTPVGTVNFADGLQLNAQPGGGQSGHGDQLVLNFGGFPSAQSFTVGSETYTVSYDGFFNSADNENTAVTSLFVTNNPGGTATAYLWGTITATPANSEITEATVPEPGSVLLLLTAVGASAAGLRRRRKAA